MQDPDQHTYRRHRAHGSWGRLFGMVATSTVVMFFLMYQLVHDLDHATFSLNRLMAALVMGCVMTGIMLIFMWDMYRDTGAKLIVLVSAAVLGAALLIANRAQVLVTDQTFLAAMIPHHSIAINNASKAALRDPRVRRLADAIIEGQMREITEMTALMADIRRNGPRGDAPLPPVPAVVTPEMEAAAKAALR